MNMRAPTIHLLGYYHVTVKSSGAREYVQLWEDADGQVWAYHDENWYPRDTFENITK